MEGNRGGEEKKKQEENSFEDVYLWRTCQKARKLLLALLQLSGSHIIVIASSWTRSH